MFMAVAFTVIGVLCFADEVDVVRALTRRRTQCCGLPRHRTQWLVPVLHTMLLWLAQAAAHCCPTTEEADMFHQSRPCTQNTFRHVSAVFGAEVLLSISVPEVFALRGVSAAIV